MTDKITSKLSLVARLSKVAQEMLDTSEQQAQGKAGPEEVQQALDVVISELQAISEAIPAEREEETPQESVAPAQEPVKPAKQEEELKTKVAELETKLALQEREVIANDYAELFEPAIQEAKYNEAIQSKDSNSIWSTKIAAIREFNSQTKNAQTKPNGFSTYQRVAKQNRERLVIL